MPRRWSEQEEKDKKKELLDLYVRQNKSISQIAPILGLTPVGVYDRLVRLRIQTQRSQKPRFSNGRILEVPPLSEDLAEFCGVMLGDGHIGTGQIFITVNIKTDQNYVPYLQDLFERLFHFTPRVTKVISEAVVNLYVTSAYLVGKLRDIGIYSSNKVRDQVGVPDWIFGEPEYQRGFLRGFFDTDGSIYRLKHFNAVQMSFSNRSVRLLEGTRQLLLGLRYHPSRFSGHSIYLTRQTDLKKYAEEIGFGNLKHHGRALIFGIANTPRIMMVQ
jgi:intein/homing endonuclease